MKKEVLSKRPAPIIRMTASIYAIVALHEAGELTEGQATKLMNSGDRISWRLSREQVLAEMRELLRADIEAQGWQWPPAESLSEEGR